MIQQYPRSRCGPQIPVEAPAEHVALAGFGRLIRFPALQLIPFSQTRTSSAYEAWGSRGTALPDRWRPAWLAGTVQRYPGGSYRPVNRVTGDQMAVYVFRAGADGVGFAAAVNEELRGLWEASNGYDPDAARRLEVIDRQTANIRRAIMDGLEDVAWANAELRKLGGQREELGLAATPVGKPPRIDAAATAVYLQHLNKTLSKAVPAEARGMLRDCVAEVRLEPEELAVDVYYTLPPAAMETGCEPSGTAAHRDRRNSGGGIRTRCELPTAPPGGSALGLCAGQAGSKRDAMDWARRLRLPSAAMHEPRPGRNPWVRIPGGIRTLVTIETPAREWQLQGRWYRSGDRWEERSRAAGTVSGQGIA